MSEKLIKSINIELNKVIDKMEAELRNFAMNNVINLVEDSLKTKQGIIFMEDALCYDIQLSSCWPVISKYNLNTTNRTQEGFSNAIKDIFPKNGNWKIPKQEEVEKIQRMTLLLNRDSYNRPYQKNNNIVEDILISSFNSYHIVNYSTFGTLNRTSTPYALPIWRLSQQQNIASPEKVLGLWLNNGLIPTEFKKIKSYLEFIEICKTYKLKKLKFNRDELLKAYNDNQLKLDFIMIGIDEVEKELLTCDKKRANISEYPKRILEDINEGHWDLWPTNLKMENPIEVKLSKGLVAKNPVDSIVDGVVGIDFGTKSTIVVYQKDSTHTLPLRIGTGNLNQDIKENHYENPTIMEFIDIDSFIKAYNSREGRPETRIEDLVTSHDAFNNMIDSPNANEFGSFFGSLKKWAGTKSMQYKLMDKKGKVVELKPYLELNDGLDPIEVYAYYLGLCINNMHNGIYLDYYLSFPVTYEVEVRDKIRESFYKGIKKSLPQALIENEEKMEEFTINEGASEPAAYAITALKEYNFAPENGEKYFYGVFDFGGGTTDFDFGIWREAEGAKERRYDYVIEHFGAGGDKYLGGENILELLAFEIFKLNSENLRKAKIQFILPPECREFIGAETLLSKSREANLNMKLLMEKLRPIWECKEDSQANNSGEIKVDLWDIDGNKKPAFELQCTQQEIEKIIKDRIERGVKNFFESIRIAFNSAVLDVGEIDKINIFLAGNSSKSIYLKELFDKYIAIETEKMKDSKIKINSDKIFEVFPPLGTKESYEKLKELGVEPKIDSLEAPTGKTGVAYGLLESRKGSKIKVVNHNNDSEEKQILFKYYLGEEKKGKFNVVIDREVGYNEWIEFIDAGEDKFEIYYSDQASVTTNTTSIDDSSIKRERIKLDVVDEDALVYIRKVSPTAIEYVVADEEGIKNDKYLGEISKIELK